VAGAYGRQDTRVKNYNWQEGEDAMTEWAPCGEADWAAVYLRSRIDPGIEAGGSQEGKLWGKNEAVMAVNELSKVKGLPRGAWVGGNPLKV